jgi:hypothetical protein
MRAESCRLNVYPDKIVNRYLDRYDPILEPWVGKDVCLSNRGLLVILLWRDYFPGHYRRDRHTVAEEFCRTASLTKQSPIQNSVACSEEVVPDGFDIIIDDARVAEPQRRPRVPFENPSNQGPMVEDWGTGLGRLA